MKSAAKLLGLLLTVIATLYFIAFAIKHIGSLPNLQWNWKMYSSFGATTVLYSTVTLTGGYAWFLLLRSVKEPAGFSKAALIFALSQFAKYLPGNVGHHVGRVVLAKSYGMNAQRVILTMVIEAGWVIVSASVVALVSLLMTGQTLLKFMPQVPSAWQILGVAVVAAAIPLLGLWAIKKWIHGSSKKPSGIEDVAIPGIGVLLSCSLLFILNFIVVGVTIDILAQSVFNMPQSRFLPLTGLFAVAWISGFIVPGAPAGLGIREAILVTGLGPLYGSGVAVGISVALRVVTTLGDGLAFGVAILARKSLQQSGQR